MTYLQSFRMLSKAQEIGFLFGDNSKANGTYFTTYYPFMLFDERKLPEFYFDDITVFYGNNGSGKSTILNVIAEKLHLNRETPYNRSDFFDDYTSMCDYRLTKTNRLPSLSRIITSDDVFDKVLDLRRLNEGIDTRKAELISDFVEERSKSASGEANLLHGLDDYDRWKEAREMRKKTTTVSQFLKTRVMRNVQERSNGESALAYFVELIKDGALYLLDEPENSLSPSNQLQLKYFIEDCVKNHGCQFIISTHSPFLLSLRWATIYNLDETPVQTREWTQLEGVREYYTFFVEHADEFED